MASKVSIDGFADAIRNELEKYGDKVSQAMPEALKATANETRKILRSTSPKGSTGKYAKGWQYELQTSRAGGGSLKIYNARPGLPHLLEHGHAVRNGTGRNSGKQFAAAQPHIEAANEFAQKQAVEELTKIIESGG